MNSAKNIDGASETDGLAVTSIPLNKDYPQGLLVVQDGRNLLPNEKQNFKYVSWHEIQSSLNL
jgi:3-phytase